MEYSHLLTTTKKYSSLKGEINFPLAFKILTMYFAGAKCLDKIIHPVLMISLKGRGQKAAVGFGDNCNQREMY